MGEVTEAERSLERFASVRLGGLVGKDGLEREYDDSLRGNDGVRFVEVSAFGRMVREAGVAPGQACVLYEGDGPGARVLGGGFIARAERATDAERALGRLMAEVQATVSL